MIQLARLSVCGPQEGVSKFRGPRARWEDNYSLVASAVYMGGLRALLNCPPEFLGGSHWFDPPGGFYTRVEPLLAYDSARTEGL